MEEVKAMTSSIDKVLKTGGFHVKKWTSNANLADDSNSEELIYLAAKQKRNEF